MNEPPPDVKTVALAMAVCDLLLNEQAKLKAIVGLLERKGLLTSAEILEAIQSISALPPESVEADAQILQRKIQERMMVRLQELMLHFGPTGSTQ